MDANEIHNRSRNRRQERRPKWQKKHHNNNNNKSNKSNKVVAIENADHQQLTKSLHELCIYHNLIESPSGTNKRRRVMNDLESMLVAWSESLMPGSLSYHENLRSPVRKGDNNNTTSEASTSLLSFGSYRLGVHTPDADVDCLVLAPPHVTRDDFFSTWVDILKENERVTDLHPVASAYTPVIKFEMDNVKIDLIFSRVNSKWLREQRAKVTQQPVTDEDDKSEERIEMIIDDSVLIGLDEASIRSVNGVRVAQELLDIFDNNPSRIEEFRLALRTIKEWAKKHGIYSNVLGFLGGVNWAILVSWVCKRNKDAPASLLVHLFFRHFSRWKWPNPVYLSKQNQPPEGVQPQPIWNPKENYRDAKHMMPIITPCYPAMNSSYNVGQPQLRRLRDELYRASQLTDDILSGKKQWDVLFECNCFFKQHANYLQVNIIGTNEEDFRTWFGYCESRMRLLIVGLESSQTRAYPFGKFFRWRNEDDYMSSSFFIGLRFAPGVSRLDIGPLAYDYLQTVNAFEGRTEGMDLTMNMVMKKDLPSFVFADDKVDRERGLDEEKKVSKKHLPPSEDSEPSANISPLKRTRIS